MRISDTIDDASTHTGHGEYNNGETTTNILAFTLPQTPYWPKRTRVLRGPTLFAFGVSLAVLVAVYATHAVHELGHFGTAAEPASPGAMVQTPVTDATRVAVSHPIADATCYLVAVSGKSGRALITFAVLAALMVGTSAQTSNGPALPAQLGRAPPLSRRLALLKVSRC